MQFKDFALEIDDVSHHNAFNVYGVIESASAAITSFALYNETPWPLFTLPHYEVQAGSLLDISGADFLALSPIVTDDTRELWEAYAIANQGWILESRAFVGDLEEGVEIPGIPEQIYPLEQTSDGGVSYLPVWQTSPAPKDTSFVNFDLLSDPAFRGLFDYILEHRKPTLSPVLNVTLLFGETAPNFGGNPQSLLVQPIFEDFGNDARIVAILVAVLPWDKFFENLLHEGVERITCVLKDTCGDEFTYKINGPEAFYIGEGDLHDREYDQLEYTSEFDPFRESEDREKTGEEEDTAKSNSSCMYSLHLYPTDQLHDEYATNKPVLLTVSVVAVFLFTSIVFLLYDAMVKRRQALVLKSAERSNAIVSSLFPADIRDRLFKHGESGESKKKNDREIAKAKGGVLSSLTDAPKMRLNTFLKDDDDEEDGILERNQADGASPVEVYDTKPIADLFPNTTVMFGDIAGFTAWSSVREPTQVFTLLETVYRAFDNIAKRRRV
jgi:hypothetical protein